MLRLIALRWIVLGVGLAMMSSGCQQEETTTFTDTPTPSPPPAMKPPVEDESQFWTDDSGNDPEWGTLRMRFVLPGPAPHLPDPELVSGDAAYCGKKPPPNENLIVNPENGGIKNVVVWLYARQDAPKVHPSYADALKSEVNLTNQWCRFEPHVSLLRTGQTLNVSNLDTIGHNTKVDLAATSNPSFNITVPAGGDIAVDNFVEGLRDPTPVNCTIHGWMKGYLLIQEHPYMAVSDADGRIEIKNLPPGEWSFQVWHEMPQLVTEAMVNGEYAEWKRGRFTETIKPGVQNKGWIAIPRSLFRYLDKSKS